MQAIPLHYKCHAKRSVNGCNATPSRPTPSAKVERDKMTPSRAAICSSRYSGQVVEEFADHHPRQQADCGHAAIDHYSGPRNPDNGLSYALS
jgi:hypothetical protein